MGRRFPHELYGEAQHPLIPVFFGRDLGYIPSLLQVLLVHHHLRRFRWSRVLRGLGTVSIPSRVSMGKCWAECISRTEDPTQKSLEVAARHRVAS